MNNQAITVVTLANAGRLDHVARQTELIPDGVLHVVVAMGDAAELRRAMPGSRVLDFGRQSLAGARNFGGDYAVALGAECVVFLDADCLPGPELVERYRQALATHPDAVVAGPVTYLPEGEIRTERPEPHSARPNPPEGTTVMADGYELFWSLSFGVTRSTWERIRRDFGGFDEGYTGYGAEDTDFGQHLRVHGIPLYWVGGAHAYHQWHPVSNPPIEHLDDIVRNANRYFDVWGKWPMLGWLEKFEAAGEAELRDGRWRVTGT